MPIPRRSRELFARALLASGALLLLLMAVAVAFGILILFVIAGVNS